MAPMDEDEFDKLRSAVAEGTVEGQRVFEEERTADHDILPARMSTVGKWLVGILTSVLVAAILGAVGIVRWTGTIEATKDAQAKELRRHDDEIRLLDEKKASKAQVQEQIKVWTEAQKTVLDNIERTNTKQHEDINGKLDKLLWEVKRSGGTR